MDILQSHQWMKSSTNSGYSWFVSSVDRVPQTLYQWIKSIEPISGYSMTYSSQRIKDEQSYQWIVYYTKPSTDKRQSIISGWSKHKKGKLIVTWHYPLTEYTKGMWQPVAGFWRKRSISNSIQVVQRPRSWIFRRLYWIEKWEDMW